MSSSQAGAHKKPRLIVLTDIGGDPDDQQSMVRLMTYSNEVDIEGLIATSRMSHGHDTHAQIIEAVIEAYAQARPNLLVHDSGYPPADTLGKVVSWGNPVPGINSIGLGKSTPGSKLIIEVVDQPDPRPVYVAVWGGLVDLAQALYEVSRDEHRSDGQKAAFIAKLRIRTSGDQDGAGEWIQRHFPDLWYVDGREAVNPATGAALGKTAPYRGIYQEAACKNDGTAQQLVPDDELGLTDLAWATKHVVGDHGPLGALYPTNVWRGPTSGTFSLNEGPGVKEGDTPTWLSLVPNGLDLPECPDFGGWGGRYLPREQSGLFLPARDKHWSGSTDVGVEQTWSVARWRRSYQNDFAARMDWAVSGRYTDANHPPHSSLGPYEHVSLSASSGEKVTLEGQGWTDPDGGALSYQWFVYDGPGSYHGPVTITDATWASASFVAPRVTSTRTLHFILEVMDDGKPALTRYQRVVVTIRPAGNRP